MATSLSAAIPSRLPTNTFVILLLADGNDKETVRAAPSSKARGADHDRHDARPRSRRWRTLSTIRWRTSFLHNWQADRFRLQQLRLMLYMLLAGLLTRASRGTLPSIFSTPLASFTGHRARPRNLRRPLRGIRTAFCASRQLHAGQRRQLRRGLTHANMRADGDAVVPIRQAIHANEFFHGPFEVVDKEAASSS